MSDTAQSSAVAMLKLSTGPSKHSVTSVSGVDSGMSLDSSFARELTRASDRSQIERSESTRSTSEKSDHAEPGQTEGTRTSRNAYREGGAGSETRQADEMQGSATSSVNELSSESEEVNTKSKASTSESDEASSSASLAEPVGDQLVGENDSSDVAMDTTAAKSNDTDDTTALAQKEIDTTILKSVYTERSADTSFVSEDTVESEVSDVFVPASEMTDAVVAGYERLSVSENTAGFATVQPRSDQSAIRDETTELSGAELEAGTTITAASDVAGKTAVLSGEQISPAQLASRQAHLPGQPVQRQGTLASLVHHTSPTVDADTGDEALRLTESKLSPVTSSPIKYVQAGDGATQQVISSSQQLISPSLESRIAAGQSVAGQVASDEGLEIADLKAADLKAADLKVAAELDAKLAARSIDQQVTQTNLAQAHQQARQQAAQVFINPVNTIATGDTAEADNVSVDNMLLSSAGGIVTAPVLLRAEAGSTQTITAPLNMPVLQGDADKAMAGNIRWMVNEGVRNAVINVTPSGMGPISVRVGKEKDHINVSIVALQGSTREALDSMLPRLREQLASQGHNSVSVDISDGRSGQSDRGYGQQGSAERHANENSSRSSSHSAKSAQDDPMSERQVEAVTGIPTALITVDSNGQVRSRYDAYV